MCRTTHKQRKTKTFRIVRREQREHLCCAIDIRYILLVTGIQRAAPLKTEKVRIEKYKGNSRNNKILADSLQMQGRSKKRYYHSITVRSSACAKMAQKTSTRADVRILHRKGSQGHCERCKQRKEMKDRKWQLVQKFCRTNAHAILQKKQNLRAMKTMHTIKSGLKSHALRF